MPDETRVTIADKVRFWEEQDKINQALIPRVLEIHDVVRDLHDRTANISVQIAAAEARVLERVRGELIGRVRLVASAALVMAVLAFALSLYQLLKEP
jgi:hypothetical protein